APPLLCGEFRLGWGGCWSAGEAQVAEVMLSQSRVLLLAEHGKEIGGWWDGGGLGQLSGEERWNAVSWLQGFAASSEVGWQRGPVRFWWKPALPMPVWWLLS
ncbi:hypothetical protein EE612_041092, partial [Oryza sativa]